MKNPRIKLTIKKENNTVYITETTSSKTVKLVLKALSESEES